MLYRTVVTHASYTGPGRQLRPIVAAWYESGRYYSVLADPEGTGLQPFSKRENIQQEKTQGEVRFPGKTSLGIKRYAQVVGVHVEGPL